MAPQLIKMKVTKANTVTISLSKEEIKEAIVCWLSRSKSTTETCYLAAYLNNDNPKIKLTKDYLTLEFKAETEEDNI